MPCKFLYFEDQDGYHLYECHCEEFEEDEDPSDYDCEEGKCPHYIDDGYDPYEEWCRREDAKLNESD